MISGAFHTTSQEWRYFSREKALIHTLHLAQLPSGTSGDTVTIGAVPPTGTGGTKGNGFNVGNLTVPDFTPYRTLTFAGTTGTVQTPYFLDFQFGTKGAFPGVHRDTQGVLNTVDAYWNCPSGAVQPGANPGGMSWMAYSRPLRFPISFGTSPQPSPETSTEYAFVADLGPGGNYNTLAPWPASNLRQLSREDLLMQENGTLWQTNLFVVQMEGGYAQPSDMQILVDNIPFPTFDGDGKGVGSAPVVNSAGANRNFGIRFGPMNLLDGPNW